MKLLRYLISSLSFAGCLTFAGEVSIGKFTFEWDRMQTTRSLFVSIRNDSAKDQAVYFSYTVNSYPNFGNPILGLKKGQVVEVPMGKTAIVFVGIDYQKVPTDKIASKTEYADFKIDSWVPYSRGPEDGNWQEVFSFLREDAYEKWQGTRPFLFKMRSLPKGVPENFSGYLLNKSKRSYDSEIFTKESMPPLQVGKVYRLSKPQFRKKIVDGESFILTGVYFKEQIRDENGFYIDREEESGFWFRTYFPEEFFNAINRFYAAQLLRNEFMDYLIQIDFPGAHSNQFDQNKIPKMPSK